MGIAATAAVVANTAVGIVFSAAVHPILFFLYPPTPCQYDYGHAW